MLVLKYHFLWASFTTVIARDVTEVIFYNLRLAQHASRRPVSNSVQSWPSKISDQCEQMQTPLNVSLILMGVGITENWTQCWASFSSSLCRSLLVKDGPGLVTLTLLIAGFLFSRYFEFHRNAWIRSIWMPKIMSTQDMKCQSPLRKELHTSGTALQGRPTISSSLSLNLDIWVVNFVGSILYICLIMSNLTF